jgi:hypothetical protein
MTRTPLDDGDKRLLRQIVDEMRSDGWARVSKVVWPVIEKLPDDLVEKKPRDDGSAEVRVTDRGLAVAAYA